MLSENDLSEGYWKNEGIRAMWKVRAWDQWLSTIPAFYPSTFYISHLLQLVHTSFLLELENMVTIHGWESGSPVTKGTSSFLLNPVRVNLREVTWWSSSGHTFFPWPITGSKADGTAPIRVWQRRGEQPWRRVVEGPAQMQTMSPWQLKKA